MASATAPIAPLFSRDEFQRLVDSGFFAGEKVGALPASVILLANTNYRELKRIFLSRVAELPVTACTR